ncbi:hypothetical protein C8R43DRAFT_1139196 [Mycena crocata]|nr:hypothetical protein C8R43DRAFT_1139196 [Mycena crocata]
MELHSPMEARQAYFNRHVLLSPSMQPDTGTQFRRLSNQATANSIHRLNPRELNPRDLALLLKYYLSTNSVLRTEHRLPHPVPSSPGPDNFFLVDWGLISHNDDRLKEKFEELGDHDTGIFVTADITTACARAAEIWEEMRSEPPSSRSSSTPE